jgi:hypothetical protein
MIKKQNNIINAYILSFNIISLLNIYKYSKTNATTHRLSSLHYCFTYRSKKTTSPHPRNSRSSKTARTLHQTSPLLSSLPLPPQRVFSNSSSSSLASSSSQSPRTCIKQKRAKGRRETPSVASEYARTSRVPSSLAIPVTPFDGEFCYLLLLFLLRLVAVQRSCTGHIKRSIYKGNVGETRHWEIPHSGGSSAFIKKHHFYIKRWHPVRRKWPRKRWARWRE